MHWAPGRKLTSSCGLWLGACAVWAAASVAVAEETRTFAVADGAVSMTAPEKWVRVEPRFAGLVLVEFQVPASEGDDKPGRVTVVGASGGVETNIGRWSGQFSQADGSATKADVKSRDIAGSTVHMVDIRGTYTDPFERPQPVARDNYRLLGAIIVTPKHGSFYVRLIGPAKTVGDHEQGFVSMIEGMQAK